MNKEKEIKTAEEILKIAQEYACVDGVHSGSGEADYRIKHFIAGYKAAISEFKNQGTGINEETVVEKIYKTPTNKSPEQKY